MAPLGRLILRQLLVIWETDDRENTADNFFKTVAVLFTVVG